ncbi:MAG: PQQ-dependent sugar dehydrogenase [Gemmatimonadales bacterium]
MPLTARLALVTLALSLWIPADRAAAQGTAECAPDSAGLTLPEGFCALVVADGIGIARHLTVAGNGDVFVALGMGRGGGEGGGVAVLRDTDGDGAADLVRRFAGGPGDDVEFFDGYLYYSTNSSVVRFPWSEGAVEPGGEAETIVRNLPATRSHRAKSIAIGSDGALYVNVGSPSNACQAQDRTAGAPGKEPCEELETRAGIWRFHSDRLRQRQADGVRFATGLRNTVALAVRPQDGKLYGVVHGRDQLSQNWPDLFTVEQGAEKPAEEFVRIEEGDDYGWPYCYYDPELGLKVQAPEYSGDGRSRGTCTEMKDPLIGFPAHWAPDGLLFYAGEQFPARYRGGAFIAFHGSWNRAPLPQGGYNVVFAPFEGDEPTGEWEVFADGFAGADKSPRGAAHRPVGVAVGPDGSLYVSDDSGGRIYRILYRGGS